MLKRILTSLKLFTLHFSLFTLIMFSGCGPFWVDPYITVKQSNLNWVEIHYYKLDRKPIHRTSVYLSGAGWVQIKKGTSELISNDFAKHSDSEGWAEIRTQRLQVDPKHINDIFQHLANHGLLDSEKNFKSAKKPRKDRVLGVKANLCNYSYNQQDNIFEVDPDLAVQLLDVIGEFVSPTL